MEKAVTQCGYDRILIVRDFNFKETDYSNQSVEVDRSTEAHKFFNKTLDMYIFQAVTEPTRKHNGQQ